MAAKLFRLIVVPFCIALLTGCSSERSEIRFGIKSRGAPLPTVQVKLQDRRLATEISLDSTAKTVGPVATAKFGNLNISFRLRSSGRDTETVGSISLPVLNDWRWEVDFWIAEEDPLNTCFGCRGSEVFQLDPVLGYEPDKKLFVVWSGNSISDPVVY